MTRFALPTPWRSARPAAACLVLLLLAATSQAQSLPSFRAELLPDQPGPVFHLGGVTDQGLVCGSVLADGQGRAFVADHQGYTLLPLPAGATSSSAADINEVGLVVGSSLGPTLSAAVVWTPGPGGYTVTVLPADGSSVPSAAHGCNDRGDVVGRTALGFAIAWNATDGTTDLWASMGLGTQLQDVNELGVGVGGGLRADLDDGTIEQLGVPTGTGSTYGWVVLSSINDAGTVGGYAVTATSSSNAFEAIRYHDVQGWKAFNIPIPQASVLAIDAADDTLFQLFYDGSPHLYVDGLGSALLESLIDPSTPGWVLAGGGLMSRSGRIAARAGNTLTGESGVIVLTRLPFVDLGGSTPGLSGRPVLRGEGSLEPGGSVHLRLLNARPAAPALLFVSIGESPVAFKGGTLHAFPPVLLAWLATDGQGRLELPVAWPALPAGTTLVMQCGVQDAATPYGAALSNGLSGTTR